VSSKKSPAKKKSTSTSKPPVAKASTTLVPPTTAHVCGVRNSGGAVTVRLMADHMLSVGGDFKLQQGTQVLDHWKMAAGTSGSADHALAASIAELDGATLVFQLLVCSPMAQINEGNVDVQYFQNGVSCPCVSPTHWSLTDVPFCKDDQVIPINSRVTFRVV